MHFPKPETSDLFWKQINMSDQKKKTGINPSRCFIITEDLCSDAIGAVTVFVREHFSTEFSDVDSSVNGMKSTSTDRSSDKNRFVSEHGKIKSSWFARYKPKRDL